MHIFLMRDEPNREKRHFMSGMIWTLLHPQATLEMLGYLPDFISPANPACARDQLDRAYAHGGGWRPFTGHTFDKEHLTLKYPGDPPQPALATTMLRDEQIIVFNCAWVMILQKDGTFEYARMD
jgi:hypothetical protein